MVWFKRISLFLVVNLAMMLTIGLIVSLLGLDRNLYRYGVDYVGLFELCFVWGMGGAIFSLLISRISAKWMMGVQVIDPNAGGEYGELVRTVHNLARAARLPAMPEVGVYESPEVNAFATGPTKSRALVAVSTGLLRTMDRDQIEGVLGHEITHVANGDMVTLTIIQGVVNAFVLFLSRLAAIAVSNALSNRDDRENSRPNYFMVSMIDFLFRIVFGIVGAMVVAWFSRWREFRADAGGARIAGREKMRSALMRLRSYSEAVDQSNPSLAAFKINGGGGGFAALFASHPPLEERIRRLETMRT
jgi:heat shock protein HtpX